MHIYKWAPATCTNTAAVHITDARLDIKHMALNNSATTCCIMVQRASRVCVSRSRPTHNSCTQERERETRSGSCMSCALALSLRPWSVTLANYFLRRCADFGPTRPPLAQEAAQQRFLPGACSRHATLSADGRPIKCKFFWLRSAHRLFCYRPFSSGPQIMLQKPTFIFQCSGGLL